MGKHRRKTKTKYIVRRVVFALLLLLVVVLGGWKLWQLFGGEDPVSGIQGEPASLPASSEPPVSAPDPAPDPEPEPQPEPDPGPDIDPQDWRLVLINHHESLEEMEREYIRRALEIYERNGSTREETAHALGIGPATLYRKIKKYGL